MNRKKPCSKQLEEQDKTCHYCNKTFTKYKSLEKHIDNTCKIKKLHDEKMESMMNEMIKRLETLEAENTECKKKIENMSKQLVAQHKTNITGDQINIGKQININIVPFGKENTSYITNQIYSSIFMRSHCSVPEYIRAIHFDKNHPENHNVYISNIKDQYVLTFDGHDWNIMDRMEAIDKLYMNGSIVLETKFEEMYNSLNETIIRQFNYFLEHKDHDDKATIFVKNEIKKLLYNCRNIVTETRQKQIDNK
jgi:uncharacterized coiled-coil protein SlyX